MDGIVSEQQIRDCFAPIYNTGTGTGIAGDDSTTSTDSPSTNDGDTGAADDAESDNDEESGGAE